MCALAPTLNVDTFSGVGRMYPYVASGFVHKVPPRVLPASLWDEYTFRGATPVKTWWMNHVYFRLEGGTVGAAENVVEVWSASKIAGFEAVAAARGESYYGPVDTRIYAMLDRHDIIRGRSVVIMGSVEPWYEIVALTYGAKNIMTVEYAARETKDPRFHIVTPAEFERKKVRYDVAFVISSFEHDGLGRYGDPLGGEADLRAMQHMRSVVAPGGYLILAIPTGPDTIIFNAQRIYGRKRLPLLMKGWELIDTVGFTDEALDIGTWGYQPVYLLRLPPTAGETSVFPDARHPPPLVISDEPAVGRGTVPIVGGRRA